MTIATSCSPDCENTNTIIINNNNTYPTKAKDSVGFNLDFPLIKDTIV